MPFYLHSPGVCRALHLILGSYLSFWSTICPSSGDRVSPVRGLTTEAADCSFPVRSLEGLSLSTARATRRSVGHLTSSRQIFREQTKWGEHFISHNFASTTPKSNRAPRIGNISSAVRNNNPFTSESSNAVTRKLHPRGISSAALQVEEEFPSTNILRTISIIKTEISPGDVARPGEGISLLGDKKVPIVLRGTNELKVSECKCVNSPRIFHRIHFLSFLLESPETLRRSIASHRRGGQDKTQMSSSSRSDATIAVEGF